MGKDPERQKIALAFLAVLTGAVVQVTSNEQPFSPWQSIVGLIMVATAQAYGSQISKGFNAEAVAYAMIYAAGIIFALGFVIDEAFATAGVSWVDSATGDQKRGFLSRYLEDDVYFVLWLALSASVFAARRVAARITRDGKGDLA